MNNISSHNLYITDKSVVQITLVRYILPVFIIVAVFVNSFALFKTIKVSLIANENQNEMQATVSE